MDVDQCRLDHLSPHATFQQSSAYGHAAAACGATVHGVALHDGKRRLATALMLERRGLRLILRGPVWADGVDQYTRRAGLRRLAWFAGATVVTPERPEAGFGLIPIYSPAHQAIWDLRPDPVALRQGLAGKWRNRLSAAERNGVVVHPAPLSRLPALMAAEQTQRAVRNYRAPGARFHAALPVNRWHLWHWYDQDRCEQGRGDVGRNDLGRNDLGSLGAGMAFYQHGAGASYLIGWAGNAARAQGVHGVMLWQAALALRADGAEWLDLGSLDTDQAPGLARFKLGTGALARGLGATCLVMPG